MSFVRMGRVSLAVPSAPTVMVLSDSGRSRVSPWSVCTWAGLRSWGEPTTLEAEGKGDKAAGAGHEAAGDIKDAAGKLKDAVKR